MAVYCVVCSHIYVGHMPVTFMQKPEEDINVFLYDFYFIFESFSLWCMFFLHIRIPVCHVHVWCPRWLDEGVGSSRMGVTDCCEPPEGVLRIKSGSSDWTASAFNCRAVCQGPQLRVSHRTWNLVFHLGWLPSEALESTHLSPNTSIWGIYRCSVFLWALGIQTQVLLLVQPCSCPLSYLLSPPIKRTGE